MRTPAKVVELLSRHQQQMDHVEEVLRVKRTVPLENQAEHVKSRSEDYWIGIAHGASNMLESVLHEYKCYAGFHHVGPKTTLDGEPFHPWVNMGHPDYTSWRVSYHTKA